jgi:ubiquinone/menaquinone biosynthesis C-methylase UbiE
VSASSPGAQWQQPELARAFLDVRKTLVPLLDIQEELLRRLFERHAHGVTRFLDVGCGDGAMSELVLSLFADAEAVLVDFSEPMLERAAGRLEDTSTRWRIIDADLSHPAWVEQLPPGGYGAAVSGLAIHHLPSERKRSLFVELYRLLEPGAMFVNMDYVSVEGPLRGLWDEQTLANAVCIERERGGSRSKAELERDLFDDSDEDRPDSVDDQLRWLREAGFEQAEVHFKWAEGAVFGGVRPEKES